MLDLDTKLDLNLTCSPHLTHSERIKIYVDGFYVNMLDFVCSHSALSRLADCTTNSANSRNVRELKSLRILEASRAQCGDSQRSTQKIILYAAQPTKLKDSE